MSQAENVEALILDALTNLNDELPAAERIEVGPATVLFGVSAEIDSMSLVSVVVDVESALRSKLGLDIVLVDDRAMNREVLPFTTVQTLKEYILELANEK